MKKSSKGKKEQLRKWLQWSALCFGCSILVSSCWSNECRENYPILVDSLDFSASIEENPEKEAVIGTVKGVTNEGGVLFTSISQSPENAFLVNPYTGELTVNDPAVFDFETNPIITGEVEVRNGEVTSISVITINVIDQILPQSGLVGYFSFSNSIADETGNYADIASNNAMYTVNRYGETHAALDVSGFGAFVDLGDSEFVSANNSFSISCWIKPTGSLTNSTIISKLSQDISCGESHQEFIIRIREGRIAPIYYQNSTSSYRGYRGETALSLDQWYHVTVIYDGSDISDNGKSRLTIFLNGQSEDITLEETQGDFPFSIENTDAHLGIGNRLDSNGNVCENVPFLGALDDLSFYDRILSAEEVLMIAADDF